MLEHLKEIGWAFFLVLILLGFIMTIFGRIVGVEPVFWTCLGFAAIIAALFLAILLGELLWLGMIKLIHRFFS